MKQTLTWTEMQPGWSWQTTDKAYVILRAVLPEDQLKPTETYTLRKRHAETFAAWPGWLGYFIAEELDLDAAKRHAERDAHHSLHARSNDEALDALPTLATARFFWPISHGTTRAALTVERDEERIVARVVGMSRGEDDYEPGTDAEIDVTELLARA